MLKKIMKNFFYMLKNKHRIIIDDLEEKKKYFIHIYIYLITKFYSIVRKINFRIRIKRTIRAYKIIYHSKYMSRTEIN